MPPPSRAAPATPRRIERHVREVKGLLESGDRVRGWDPLFREIFDHYDQAVHESTPLPEGYERAPKLGNSESR